MFRSNFKRDLSFENRLDESSRVITKYPDRKPIICEKLNTASNFKLADIDKKKYLVPVELTIGQFIYVIRKRIKLNSEEALFLFINNKIISSTAIIGDVYQNERDRDGFLYIQYSKENIFG